MSNDAVDTAVCIEWSLLNATVKEFLKLVYISHSSHKNKSGIFIVAYNVLFKSYLVLY